MYRFFIRFCFEFDFL